MVTDFGYFFMNCNPLSNSLAMREARSFFTAWTSSLRVWGSRVTSASGMFTHTSGPCGCTGFFSAFFFCGNMIGLIISHQATSLLVCNTPALRGMHKNPNRRRPIPPPNPPVLRAQYPVGRRLDAVDLPRGGDTQRDLFSVMF